MPLDCGGGGVSAGQTFLPQGLQVGAPTQAVVPFGAPV